MHPILFRIGPLEIHSYGLMLAISFFVGILWASKRGEERGIKQSDVMDLSFIIVLCAIIGSRLLYVVTHLEQFRGRWTDTFNPFQSNGEIGISGLTMLGGVVLSAVAIVVFCVVKNINLLRLLDSLSPAFGIGIFITRIGCFLNGCCFGKPSDLPWSVVFPLTSPAGYTLQGLHLHPTQLYSSLYGILITVILVILDRKKRFDGFIVSIFLVFYGASRFLVDYVRYYEDSVKFLLLGFRFTVNQGISFLMVLSGAVIFFIFKNLRKETI